MFNVKAVTDLRVGDIVLGVTSGKSCYWEVLAIDEDYGGRPFVKMWALRCDHNPDLVGSTHLFYSFGFSITTVLNR